MPRDKIRIEATFGTNNISPKEDEPSVVLNMDVLMKKMQVRSGYSKLVSLTNCHSVFAVEDFLLCVAQGGNAQNLFRVDRDGSTTELGVVDGDDPVSYLLIDDKVYAGSRTWNGKFNISSNSLSNWGVLPPISAPACTSSAGGRLPIGKYALCFTDRVGDERSGQGPICYIDVQDDGLITIGNPGKEVWVSSMGDPNFYYLGEVTYIDSLPGVTVMQSLDVISPPFLEHLVHYLGRIFGVDSNNDLRYSEAFAYSWFKRENFIPVTEAVTMVAIGSDNEGLYIGTTESVWFISGDSVRSLVTKRIGVGSIKGTLAYCDFEKLGKKIPVWAGLDGVYSGKGGKLTKITEDRLRYDPGTSGAGFFRLVNGEPQFVSNFQQPSNVKFGDSVSVQVYRNGKVFTPTFGAEVLDSFRGYDRPSHREEVIRDSYNLSDTVIDNLV